MPKIAYLIKSAQSPFYSLLSVFCLSSSLFVFSSFFFSVRLSSSLPFPSVCLSSVFCSFSVCLPFRFLCLVPFCLPLSSSVLFSSLLLGFLSLILHPDSLLMVLDLLLSVCCLPGFRSLVCLCLPLCVFLIYTILIVFLSPFP